MERYSHDHTPFMLWNRGKDRVWGAVKPCFLLFASMEAGEEVAARYRRTYPDQDFVVSTSKPANDA